MNARDKELALQAWTENDWEGYLNIKKLMALVRADEREAAEERVVDLFTAMQTPYLPDITAAIRARGNT